MQLVVASCNAKGQYPAALPCHKQDHSTHLLLLLATYCWWAARCSPCCLQLLLQLRCLLPVHSHQLLPLRLCCCVLLFQALLLILQLLQLLL